MTFPLLSESLTVFGVLEEGGAAFVSGSAACSGGTLSTFVVFLGVRSFGGRCFLLSFPGVAWRLMYAPLSSWSVRLRLLCVSSSMVLDFRCLVH